MTTIAFSAICSEINYDGLDETAHPMMVTTERRVARGCAKTSVPDIFPSQSPAIHSTGNEGQRSNSERPCASQSERSAVTPTPLSPDAAIPEYRTRPAKRAATEPRLVYKYTVDDSYRDTPPELYSPVFTHGRTHRHDDDNTPYSS